MLRLRQSSESRTKTNATAHPKRPGVKKSTPIEAFELTMAHARQVVGCWRAGRELDAASPPLSSTWRQCAGQGGGGCAWTA